MSIEQGLTERLGIVIDRHSQAQIAKQTGFSRANVSAYAKGTRIPASFAAALVEKLGVNPSWLLTGQGMPFRLDVLPNAAKGESAEALVDALKAITKLKFGELAGKRELEDLRKLADALAEFQRHSDTVRRTFLGLFEDYEKAITDALHNKELDLVDSLSEVALEIAYLCRDRDFERRVLHYRGQGAYYRGDFETNLALRRTLFLEELAYDGETSFGRIGPIIDYVLALMSAFEKDEAQRTARAALELFADHPHEVKYQFLRTVSAYVHFSQGFVSEALPTLVDSYARLDEFYKRRNLHCVRIPMLCAGACDFDELAALVDGFAFATPHSKHTFAAFVLSHVTICEERELLGAMLRAFTPAIEAIHEGFGQPSLLHVQALHRALEKRDQNAWKQYLETPVVRAITESTITGDRISQALAAEQIARASGNMAAARKLALQAYQEIQAHSGEKPLNSVGTINYADALIAHFGQAFQRRAKSAPSAACVEAALNDLRALRKRGFALIDRHPRLGALVSA